MIFCKNKIDPVNETTVPSVKGAINQAKAVSDLLAVREGQTGDPLDQNVTFRDLVNSGLMSLAVNGQVFTGPQTPDSPFGSILFPNTGTTSIIQAGGSGSGSGVACPVSTTPVVPVPPYYLIPLAIQNFTATAGVGVVILTWTQVNYRGVSYLEIWRAQTNDLSKAVLLAQVGPYTLSYADSIGNFSETEYYWIRGVGLSGPGPFNATQGTSATTLQIPGYDIIPGSIESGAFAEGLTAVGLVSSLPSTTGYTGPSLVFNTGDNKLYQLIGSNWVVAVGAGAGGLEPPITGTQIGKCTITSCNIAGNTIIGGKIAACTITGCKILANSVDGGRIAAGTLTATQIHAGTITSVQIAANTIAGSNIAGQTIVACNIKSGTITGTQIAANTITAGNIAANTITGCRIASCTILANNIKAGAITAAQIEAGTLTNAQIAGLTILGANIAHETIIGCNIAACTITAVHLRAKTITACSEILNCAAVTTPAMAPNAATTAVTNSGVGNTLTISVSSNGYPSLVFFQVTGANGMVLYVDGVAQATSDNDITTNVHYTMKDFQILNLASGTHTLEVQVTAGINNANISMVYLEFKR